jgi:hypothetical protein
MLSGLVSAKITLFLFITLLLSGTLNYALYNKNKVNSFVIEQQSQSIKDLNKAIEFNGVVKAITESTFSGVVTDIQKSDVSFEILKDKLQNVDKCKKQDVSTTKVSDKNAKAIESVDPDVVVLYDVLRSAYNLQNKN